MAYLLGLAMASATFAALGAYVAAQKRRPVPEGAVLGAVFGPVGCLIEACLPAFAPPSATKAKGKGKAYRPLPSPWAWEEPKPAGPDEDLAAELLR